MSADIRCCVFPLEGILTWEARTGWHLEGMSIEHRYMCELLKITVLEEND